MKTNVWIMMLLFIVSGLSMKLVAQDNLSAMVKKCETIPSVNMNVVREKDPETNKLVIKVISITINDNQALVDEFLAAFKKDEDKVNQMVENKLEGEISLLYEFEKVSFSISYGKTEGYASVNVLY